jgi:UV DNA damage repair endonuclease
MIDIDNLEQILQDIYQRLMIDADDIGMAYDEILQYVENFEMDEDMLFSFIKDKVKENKEVRKGRDVMESLKRALRDPLS